MKRLLLFLFASAALTTSLKAEPTAPRWNIISPFPQIQLALPVYLTYPPDGSDRLFVIEQGGRVVWFENRHDELRLDVALDLTKKIRREHMEEGLLGMAFHPQFKSNREVFFYYSASNPRRNVLARFKMNSARTKIDPASEEIILSIEKPYGNHNGGMIEFGPDKYLYVAVGDGGGAGDPHGNGQSKNTLLGKILRIDVDKKTGNLPYAIPPDNPFVNDSNARGEIWAYGLRNVWRFSFDRANGTLWAGDVGQDAWEEIDIITKGLNYGWNVREGAHSFERTQIKNAPGPFKEPVIDLSRKEAQSITGGYVYRGKKWPELSGKYIYADFMKGTIWALTEKDGSLQENVVLTKGSTISSFGEDKDGELYFLGLYDGKIYTLTKN